MSIPGAFHRVLMTDAALLARHAKRVYFGNKITDAKTECLVLEFPDDEADSVEDTGDTGITFGECLVHCFSPTYTGAQSLAALVRTALFRCEATNSDGEIIDVTDCRKSDLPLSNAEGGDEPVQYGVTVTLTYIAA